VPVPLRTQKLAANSRIVFDCRNARGKKREDRAELGKGHGLYGDAACDRRFVHPRRARWGRGCPIECGLAQCLAERVSPAAGAADAERAYSRRVFRRLFAGRPDDRFGEL
jgi:hypothetical protein